MTLGQQVLAAKDLVAVLDLGGRDARGPRPQGQYVVVFGGLFIGAADPHHDHEQPILFDLPIVTAVGTQQFGSTDLEIGEVVRVMQDPHSVRLLISDADRGVLLEDHGHRNCLEIHFWGDRRRMPIRAFRP